MHAISKCSALRGFSVIARLIEFRSTFPFGISLTDLIYWALCRSICESCLLMSSVIDSITPNATDEELEHWWEKFLAEKRRDDAQDEDTRQQWDNFATRKLKFIREFRFLTDLYEPIGKVVHSILSNDHIHRGQKLYGEWCKFVFFIIRHSFQKFNRTILFFYSGKVGKKECLLAYYDTPVFRAIYTNYRFLSSATSFLQVSMLLYHLLKCSQWSLQKYACIPKANSI